MAYFSSVVIGALVGAAAWLLDAVFFDFYTVGGTFTGALWAEVPAYRLAIRFLIIIVALLVGSYRAYSKWHGEREFFGLDTSGTAKPARQEVLLEAIPRPSRWKRPRKEKSLANVDPYDEEQRQRLWHYALLLSEAVHLEPRRMVGVRTLCWAYNIGYIGVSDNEPDRQAHCEVGARILECLPGLAESADLIRFHHERWDGSGPLGLTEENIPLADRIFTVVWYYDSLVYRRHLRNEDALRMLYHYRGNALDPALVDAFIKLMSRGRLTVVPSAQREAIWS